MFNVDLGLRFAEGESSITLSLSPSTFLGDAKIGDNLLLETRVPAADLGIGGLLGKPE
jgi:hypothetical protein